MRSASRRDRLARAVADFDAATIATTHGFCQEVLAELGTVGDLDRETAFVEDVSELVEQALDDLYVRRFGPEGGARFPRSQALRIAREAVFSPTAKLEPADEPKDTSAAMRYRLAKRVRDEVAQRKRRLAIMTYDDLLTRLNEILAGPTGPEARERLRARYDVVLVDEFQDTDPIQWQILYRAFAKEGVTLVLVADPKQAIYAFRGADVYAYLVAAATAATQATLRVNRRSDQPLLDAFDSFFADARLGHEEIVYRKVRATRAHQTSRLIGAPEDGALRIRVVHRDEPGLDLTNHGYAKAASAREHVARDVAADVVRLLSSQATLEHRAADGKPTRQEPVRPRHIAVLVRTHANADLVCAQLGAVRVPAVINGGGNVFATATARGWLRLLEALERPAETIRAKTAAATPFLGWSGERIATAPEPEWEEVHRRLHRWGRILRDSGVAALTEAIVVGEDLAARMLAEVGGERRLTDLGHVADLLHRAAAAERLGVTALRGWLAKRIADSEGDRPEDERTRRLDSDAEAVQVLTIHRSKGLEFPVVYCPFLWEPSPVPRDPEPVSYHDPATGFRHTIDVGLEGRAWNAHVRRSRAEQRGEDLRLAYVALTRAKHRAVIWWAGSFDSRNSPVGRLLFAKGADGEVAPEGRSTPTDAAAVERFRELRRSRAGPHRGRALDVRGRARRVESAARTAGRARSGAVEPPPRSVVAADLLHRHHRRGPRSAGVERTRAAGPERRARRGDARLGHRRAAAGAEPRIAVGGSAGGGPLRNVRAYACSRRPTSRRPALMRRSPRRSRARKLGGPSTSVSPIESSMGCARRSKRRSGRWSTGCGSVTSLAPTGSTNSSSNCPWPAATSPPAGSRCRRSPRCSEPICRAPIRWPNMRVGSRTRRFARPCAASSPGVSIS